MHSIVLWMSVFSIAFALLLALALGAIAKDADKDEREAGVLAFLDRVRSPSGKPFFPSRESVWEFTSTLEGARGDSHHPR
jgi:hypothetical protein